MLPAAGLVDTALREGGKNVGEYAERCEAPGPETHGEEAGAHGGDEPGSAVMVCWRRCRPAPGWCSKPPLGRTALSGWPMPVRWGWSWIASWDRNSRRQTTRNIRVLAKEPTD